ncbi:hypothetical protein PIB30_008672 [Stylosanthes scabra]|uniref:PB1-like domain-containing protein n=1 Tax=Stylosanthes scabra TaxID=79078 RepID=A0ABU6T5D2_9FABA|nr:hypothetical protein [Stylosanthes scabra]
MPKGNTKVLAGVEEDTLDVFFVKNYYKKLKCDKAKTCLWKVPGISLELGLRKLEFDADLFEMVRDCRRNNNIINIYFDHGVSNPHMSEDDDVVVLSKSTSQPNKPNATFQPMKSTSHLARSSSQPTVQPQIQKLTSQPKTQPFKAAPKTSMGVGQPLKTVGHPNKAKSTTGNKHAKEDVSCKTKTRAGRTVKPSPVQEDSDSHNSYESANNQRTCKEKGRETGWI